MFRQFIFFFLFIVMLNTPLYALEYDFDGDRDVDGKDLSHWISQGGFDLPELATELGGTQGEQYNVKPTGTRIGGASVPGDWSDANCYGTVQAAIAALSADGDEIVLKKSLDHIFSENERIKYTFTMRNEDNDEDASECVVTVSDNVNFKPLFTAKNKDWIFKGITFTGATYTGSCLNYALFEDYYDHDGNVSIIGCIIDGISQTVIDKQGCVLFLNGSATTTASVTFARTEIKNCLGNGVRGAFRHVVEILDMNVIADGLNYHDNGDAASYRGGVFHIAAAQKNIAVTVSNSTIANNENVNIDGWGDGVFKTENLVKSGFFVTANYTNCTIIGNRCGQGNLYCGKNTIATVDSCTFYDNVAIYNGGALRRGGEDDDQEIGKTIVLNSYFYNNTARYGGAISINASNRHKWAEIYNCIFQNNSASRQGDAVFCNNAHDGVSQKSIVKNCTIQGAATTGYHIYGAMNDGFGEISNCYIEGGISAINDTGATISNIYEYTAQ